MLQMKRIVHDTVHGNIAFTDEEARVMGHPLMLRMQWIAQFDLKRLVFPSATHTRFAHLLGAMHVAGRILQAVFDGSERSIPSATSAISHNQAYPYHVVSEETRDEITRITRLAALVHDIGHGPLSHTFEPFFPVASSLEILFKDTRLRAIRPYATKILAGDSSGRVTHEALSCIYFAIICGDIGIDDDTASAVAAILLRERAVLRSAKTQTWFPAWVHFAQTIVSSAPADADRMDYLLRDSMTLGVPYGLFSIDRILKSALCMKDRHDNYNLAWRVSGLPAFEDLLCSRYQMYQQVYYGKTTMAIKAQLSAIASAAAGKLTVMDVSSVTALVASVIFLTDEHFLLMLAAPDCHGERLEHAKLIAEVLARKFWKRVYEFREEYGNKEPRRILPSLKKAFANSGVRFHIDEQHLGPLKDLASGASLLKRGADGMLRALPTNQSWTVVSPILGAMQHSPPKIVRIYAEGTFTREQFVEMCQKAARLGAPKK